MYDALVPRYPWTKPAFMLCFIPSHSLHMVLLGTIARVHEGPTEVSGYGPPQLVFAARHHVRDFSALSVAHWLKENSALHRE